MMTEALAKANMSDCSPKELAFAELLADHTDTRTVDEKAVEAGWKDGKHGYRDCRTPDLPIGIVKYEKEFSGVDYQTSDIFPVPSSTSATEVEDIHSQGGRPAREPGPASLLWPMPSVFVLVLAGGRDFLYNRSPTSERAVFSF